MHILDKISVDNSKRIVITTLFVNTKVPKNVGIAYHVENQELVIVPYDKTQGFLNRKVDSKNRVTLSSWMVEDFADKIYLAVDDKGRRFLRIGHSS